jgi:hypothetical protein
LPDYDVPGANPGIGEEAKQYEQVIDVGPSKQDRDNFEQGDKGFHQARRFATCASVSSPGIC